MKRSKKLVLSLCASAALALGAATPALGFHQPPPPIPSNAPVTSSDICVNSGHNAPWCRHK